jgi:hypothetical protein
MRLRTLLKPTLLLAALAAWLLAAGLLWWAPPLRPRAILPGTGGKDGCRLLAFSPDSKTLAIICDSDTSIRLWDVAAATQQAYIEETDEITPGSTQFSPDSQLALRRYHPIRRAVGHKRCTQASPT